MPYNLPSYTTSKFSIGPGKLYLGVSGAEPSVDVGAVRSGMTIATTREKVDIYQGFPRTLVETFTVQETGTVTFQGLEWNLDNIAKALGAGSVTSDASYNYFDFGGQITFTNVALKFVHEKPNGKTIQYNIWKARGSGEFTVTFGDDPHEIPYTFDMLVATTDWNGASLAVGKQLYRIIEQK